MVAMAATFLALSAGGAAAFRQQHQSIVSLGGAVATPETYSLSQLEALPLTHTTFSITRRTWWGARTETDQGVSLEDLVNFTGPTLPSAKNALLRVTATVSPGA